MEAEAEGLHVKCSCKIGQCSSAPLLQCHSYYRCIDVQSRAVKQRRPLPCEMACEEAPARRQAPQPLPLA